MNTRNSASAQTEQTPKINGPRTYLPTVGTHWAHKLKALLSRPFGTIVWGARRGSRGRAAHLSITSPGWAAWAGLAGKTGRSRGLRHAAGGGREDHFIPVVAKQRDCQPPFCKREPDFGIANFVRSLYVLVRSFSGLCWK